jgi:hypothetical protein
LGSGNVGDRRPVSAGTRFTSGYVGALARCVFNGVGCDEELAACPWEPCPCCLRKLQRAGAIKDAKQLFARLVAFLERHEATAREAAFLACRLNNM